MGKVFNLVIYRCGIHFNLGNPIYADPSSGAWYPIVWLIGYFKGYSVYALSFELWLHVFIGGIGFYKLSKTMGLFSVFAIIAAISYMLSGFYVGNAQHLPYVISACWLPFIIHYYLKLIQGGDWSNVIKGSLSLFMLITGGYPAFTIILFYLLSAFFVIRLFEIIKSKESFTPFLLKNFAFLMATITVSIVMILSIYQVFPFLTRLSTFNLQNALFSPFSPQCFVSFVLPYATTIRDFDYFDSDLAMRNAYFGIVILFFFIAGAFKKSSPNHRVFFYFGLLSLTAAVGNYLPVREFLFNYVPMMSLFRFPSVFRLFVILSGILSGVIFLQSYFTENGISKKRMLTYISVVIIGLIIVVHIALNEEAFNLSEYVQENIFNLSSTADFWKHIAFQGILQLIIFVVLFVLFWKVKNKSKLILSILVLITIDMTIATQLNAPSTVYSHKWSGDITSKKIESFPKGFPPLMNISMQEAEDLPEVGHPFLLNMSVFNKQITSNGYNSFIFSSYENYLWAYPALHTEILKNNVVQLSDQVLPLSEIEKFKKDSLFTTNTLFFNEVEFKKLNVLNLNHSEKDCAKIIDYGPQYFKIKASSEKQQLLTLYQKNYTGWGLTVNGEEQEIFTSNMNFMSFVLPSGQSEVVFEYKNKSIVVAFWVSVLTLFSMVLYLIILPFKKKSMK